jgi:glycosyltransferase involved in cell wall biosynthesis
MPNIKLKSWIGHRIRECHLHFQRFRLPSTRPRIVFFPSSGNDGFSSGLRAYEISRQMSRIGWRSIVIPTQLELCQRRRILKAEKPEFVFLQKSRHILNRPSLYPEHRCVFDIDDADYLDERQAGPVLECCRDSKAVIAGSRFVADWCGRHNPNTHIIWTGNQAPTNRAMRKSSARTPAFGWAHSTPDGFPLERELVCQIIETLAKRGVRFEFRIWGVSDRDKIKNVIETTSKFGVPLKTYSFMTYDKFIESLRDLAVGLQPVVSDNPYSQGRSFGKILGYLSQDVAVVASNNVDHPLFFRHRENGWLANTIEQWADGVQWLLENPAEREKIADQAWNDYLTHLTSAAAAKKIDAILRKML